MNIPEQVGKGVLHSPVCKHSISSGPSSVYGLLQLNCNLCPVFIVSLGGIPVTLRWLCITPILQVISAINKTCYQMKKL